MVWVTLIVISIVVSVVVLGTLGGLCGMGLLVALNGFSESQATPIIGCYALLVISLNTALVSFINWMVAGKWFSAASLSWWGIVALSLATTMIMAVLPFALVALKNSL